MKKILQITALAVLVLGVWTLVVLEVYQSRYVEPMFVQYEQAMQKLASTEASKVMDARLKSLTRQYEDGQNGRVSYESPEALFWWIGYKQEAMSDDQDRIFGAMEEVFHRDPVTGAKWRRVHMAIDNKPTWQPEDEPFLTYTEDK